MSATGMIGAGLQAAKGLLGSGPTGHATAYGNTDKNTFAPTISAGGNAASKLATASQTVLAAAAVYWIAVNTYDMYDKKDDHRLLLKLGAEGCGGLSQMPPNIEGCYRQYVSKAIHRSIATSNYVPLYNRFQECFGGRKELLCSWWGENVF